MHKMKLKWTTPENFLAIGSYFECNIYRDTVLDWLEEEEEEEEEELGGGGGGRGRGRRRRKMMKNS